MRLPLVVGVMFLALVSFASSAWSSPQPVQPGSPQDRWRLYLASENVCPGRADETALPAVQQQAALCLLNFARRQRALPPLAQSPLLSSSAAQRAADIVRCDQFSHTACGKRPDRYAIMRGYRGSFGENLFAGVPTLNSPLAAVDAWLNSPHHRAIIFTQRWQTLGVALQYASNLEGVDNVAVWVSDFGD
jgi:uncharacterized protein YkwD